MAILAVLCLSVFIALIDNTIVNVALPSISRQLHAATSDLQWIVDAYSLVFASLLLVGGSLGDRYGRKGALQAGLVAFAGFSAFAGLSGSTHVLIVARCLMGLAAALIFPATLAILTSTFTDARERAATVGVWTAITGLGVALGPITGGLLLEHFSWSSVFFATIPVAVLALALGAWLVPASRDPAAPRLDLVGFVLSIAGVGAVVYTTIEAPARGWLAPVTLAGYGAGVALLAVFALWERRAGEPMLEHHPVPRYPLQRRQLLHRGRVLRPVRLHLPDHPVLPDRLRLQPPVGRHPHAPVRPGHRCRGAGRPAARRPPGHQDRGPRWPDTDGRRLLHRVDPRERQRVLRPGPDLDGGDGGQARPGDRAVNRRHPGGPPAGQGGGRLSGQRRHP
ncbi:MAG TPA: MFS transporter [Trebonia sp.]|nr:MFS transporter [Trebonia sp.]